MKRLLCLIIVSFLALLMIVPGAGAQGNQQTVSIKNFAFNPPSITVAPGTTVPWTNNDSAPHTVTADDGSFDSETLQPGQSFSHTFQSPGTIAYHCEIHPSMKGSVTVGGGGGTTTPAGRGTSSTTATMPQATAALPPTGGMVASSVLFLPAAALLIGSGIVVYGVLRRRG